MTPTRRQFLVAGATAGGTALLAACAADSPSTSPPTNPGDTAVPAQRSDGTDLPKAFALVQRFPNHPLFIPGQEERLPVSIMKVASNDQNGGLRDNGPETIEGWIEDFNKVKITDVVAARHFDGITNAYWVARATLPKAVVYTLRLKGDDVRLGFSRDRTSLQPYASWSRNDALGEAGNYTLNLSASGNDRKSDTTSRLRYT
ncbi:MAG: twin-arginine translocation signal domain-containing protein, partial [Actinomycetota bacterium]